MAAYLQYRAQQRGDVYGSASFPWGEFDGRFRNMVLPSCRYRHWYLYRCHRRSCDDCLIHDSIILIVEYPGVGSPLNYKGLTANASGKARLSGKIPQALRARMIFPRNPKGPALPSEKRRLPTLPGSFRYAKSVFSSLFLLSLSLWFPVPQRAENKKSRPGRQPCSVRFHLILYGSYVSWSNIVRIPEN